MNKALGMQNQLEKKSCTRPKNILSMLKYFVLPSEKMINVSPKLILKTVRNNIGNHNFE